MEFLHELGRDIDFRLDDPSIARILDLLADPVPYHVQLFVSALRNVCRGDSSLASAQTIDLCFDEHLAGESGTAHLDHYEKRLELALDEQEYAIARSILGLACRGAGGVRLSELGRLSWESEPTFQAVLRDLKADGYVTEVDRRLIFRSNLLRAWWRKHHGRG